MDHIHQLQHREAELTQQNKDYGLTSQESRELTNIRQQLQRLQLGRPSQDDEQPSKPLCMGTSF